MSDNPDMAIAYDALRVEGIRRGLLVPVSKWTDDEWLEVLTRFPPKTDMSRAEMWVAEQRRKSAHE